MKKNIVTSIGCLGLLIFAFSVFIPAKSSGKDSIEKIVPKMLDRLPDGANSAPIQAFFIVPDQGPIGTLIMVNRS